MFPPQRPFCRLRCCYLPFILAKCCVISRICARAGARCYSSVHICARYCKHQRPATHMHGVLTHSMPAPHAWFGGQRPPHYLRMRPRMLCIMVLQDHILIGPFGPLAQRVRIPCIVMAFQSQFSTDLKVGLKSCVEPGPLRGPYAINLFPLCSLGAVSLGPPLHKGSSSVSCLACKGDAPLQVTIESHRVTTYYQSPGGGFRGHVPRPGAMKHGYTAYLPRRVSNLQAKAPRRVIMHHIWAHNTAYQGSGDLSPQYKSPAG